MCEKKTQFKVNAEKFYIKGSVSSLCYRILSALNGIYVLLTQYKEPPTTKKTLPVFFLSIIYKSDINSLLICVKIKSLHENIIIYPHGFVFES